jgi:hypothetical protein
MVMAAAPRPIVRDADDAVALTNAALDAMDVLQPILERETTLLADGDTQEALKLTVDKDLAAKSYITLIEAIKTNTVALQRLRPDAIALLKERHVDFEAVMNQNLAVLSTARTVAESIIREVSAEVAKAASPQAYGPGMALSRAAAKTPTSVPLAISKKI